MRPLVHFIYLVSLSSIVDAWPLLNAWKKRATSFAPLRFTKDGTFQLSVFEDLHFGELEGTISGWWQDFRSVATMKLLLAYESPQLAVLNGDLITGENTQKATAASYFDQIAGPLVDAGLPWASTYGNHDSDFNLSRSAIYELEKTYANSLTQNMVSSTDNSSGITNYYLEVFAADTSIKTPKLILWFFDSRGGNYYQKKDSAGNPIGQPNWVDPTVATWLSTASANITATYGKTIPSLAFVHIPVQAFLAFQNAGVDTNTEPGINDDVPLSQQGVASGQGGTSTVYTYSGQDVSFMQALLNLNGLMAVFSGHDHGNDWCFKWNSKLSGMSLTGNGVNLCFGRHSGYGGYGSWTRGARQILISLDSSGEVKPVETWIRQEGSVVSGRVTLNSTYGADKYATVKDTDSWL